MMKTRKRMITLIAAVIAAMAGTDAAHAAAASPETTQAASPAAHAGAGVLKAVNAKAGKVEIAHGPIPSLHWPAMTMWFALQGPLPADLKAGDEVRFVLGQTRNGEWAITRIERGH